MKTTIKYIPLLAILIAMMGVLVSSCEKEETPADSGNPAVYYVRTTDPAEGDSLLVGAFMGSLIAIVGEDLYDTRELWFNDQKATLNPAYITDKTILVSVPSTVPTAVTDQIRFVFADGQELLYDFKVNVPGPEISSIKSEYVPDGETAVLYGDFFFDPKVYFPGDMEAELVSISKTQLEVTVPAGASPGQITVETLFGKTKSSFRFRDNRNTLLDYDSYIHETWTAPMTNVANDPAPAPCSGNYAYFKHNAVGAWMWTNELTMQYWAPRGRGNIPVATGLVSELDLRFEVNVPIEWKEIRMEIFFGPYAEDHGRDVAGTSMARWKPWAGGPYKTDGWETVSIPLSEFKYGKDDADDDEFGTMPLGNLSSLTNVTMSDAKLGIAQNIGALAVGQALTLTGSYGPVKESDLPSPIFNTAGVTGTTTVGAPVGPVTDTHSVTVTINPELQITKTGTPGPVTVGDMVNYTITVENTGNVTLTNVTVTDARLGLNENVGTVAVGAAEVMQVRRAEWSCCPPG